MFSIFKSDPAKKLNKLYLAKLEQAMQEQRNGDIMAYSELTAEAEGIQRQIQALKSQKS